MLKKGLIYLLLSTIVVVFSKYAQLLFIYIDIFYTHLNLRLAPLFASHQEGKILCAVLVLTAAPVVIVGCPAVIYRMVKKSQLPYQYEATWLIWVSMVVSKIMIH